MEDLKEKLIEELAMAMTHSEQGFYDKNEKFVRDLIEPYFEKRLKEILPEKKTELMPRPQDNRHNFSDYNIYIKGYNQCLTDILQSQETKEFINNLST